MRRTDLESISRRQVIASGIAAGVAAALPGSAVWAAAPNTKPILRTIPSSGEKIPVVGIGTNAFDVSAAEELATRKQVLQNLPLLGGSLVDTAQAYGKSEEVIGQLVAELGNRDKLFLSTKTPLGGDVSNAKAVIEKSFARLRTDRIDLYEIHNFYATDALLPVLREYQQQRVCTLLDPGRDPLGKGFHIIQGMIAIGSGGIFGKGFMQGTQTHLDFIPERTTDFIFAAYGEEFGLFGNLLLIAGFVMLVLRGLAIALEGPTLFARLLAGSVTLIFFTYAFVNMGMVSGILPVVGVPLPFISYGGTAMVTLGLGVGILMSIARSKQLVQS